MNNTNVNDMIEESVPKEKNVTEPAPLVETEGTGNKEEVEPVEEGFFNIMGTSNKKIRAGHIVPETSYEVLNGAQMEINEMNNL